MATVKLVESAVAGVRSALLAPGDHTEWAQLSGGRNALSIVEARASGADFGGGAISVEVSASKEEEFPGGFPYRQPTGELGPTLTEDGVIELSTGAPYFRVRFTGGSGSVRVAVGGGS